MSDPDLKSIILWMTSRTEEEKVHKYIFCGEEKRGIYLERRKIYFFVMVKKNIGEKGGKYLEYI